MREFSNFIPTIPSHACCRNFNAHIYYVVNKWKPVFLMYFILLPRETVINNLSFSCFHFIFSYNALNKIAGNSQHNFWYMDKNKITIIAFILNIHFLRQWYKFHHLKPDISAAGKYISAAGIFLYININMMKIPWKLKLCAFYSIAQMCDWWKYKANI